MSVCAIIITYWVKILHANDNKYVKKVYTMLKYDFESNPDKKNWCSLLYDLLCTLGFNYKFDKFIFIIFKRSQTHEENTCRIILYTLSLKKKLHTCIIPCNTTLVWHIDKISTKNTHIIMDTFIILLF